MIIVQTATYMIKTRYYKNNNGSHWFQRRVPNDLRKHFLTPHVTIKLSGKESSMVAEISRHTRSTDKLFADYRNGLIDPEETEANNILKLYDLWPGAGNVRVTDNDWNDQPHLDIFLSDMMEKKGRTAAEDLAVTLLRKPAPMTLAKALNFYFEYHPKGSNTAFQTESKQHSAKIIDKLGSYNIESITRQMVKDFIIERATEVKTATVKRELSVPKAALNMVIREKGLDIKNPFEHQTIPNYGHDKRIRETFSDDELRLIIKSCLAKPNDAAVILMICALTCTRLSEVAGLRRSDIKLTESIPHISLMEYGGRSLKTKNSIRDIPLVSFAVEVLNKHLATHNSDMAFPRYNKDGKVLGDTASATINKLIKRIGIADKTTHCTRHTMRDLLVHADIPTHLIDAIGGWGSKSIGESYGKGHSLLQKQKALEKALEPILK